MSLARALVPVLAAALAPTLAAAAPAVDLHRLAWYVHEDMVDDGSNGEPPLSFYGALLDEKIAEANALLQGHHGAADAPCCTRIEKASLQTYAGAGLDMPDSAADFSALSAIGSGSRAFLVRTLGWCGAPAPTAIGCADTPSCDGDPDDDPDLILVVSMEAHDVFGVLHRVLAHERGHNACLSHTTGDPCELMASAGGGGCLSSAECADYLAGRTDASADTCACHTDAMTTEDDGGVCTEGMLTGICSGGLCGEVGSDASARIFAAGGPASYEGDPPDDPLVLSGLTGGWTDLGDFGGGAAPTGVAYDPDRDVVFGVVPTAGDHDLVEIDPTSGGILATVGGVTGMSNLTALAFDPGATTGPGDDVLYAIETEAGCSVAAPCSGQLLEIDPATAAPTLLGTLNYSLGGGFQGLAFDIANDALYASAFSSEGLWQIDVSCPFLCSATQVTGVGLVRRANGLAYCEETGKLYMVGSQAGPQTLYDVIDADTFATQTPIHIDHFTPGGLAGLGLPEPPAALGQGVSLVALALLARLRGRRAAR